jgi:DNA (cytosine-5)-methyltransferase 3A
MKLKVLSLFDGMACGRIALERAGFGVEAYHASEIDKWAMQVAMKNYPDIVQIGDVCRVDGMKYRDFDMLIGGSPCQGFSFAGKQLNFDDPRSALFFEYVRILKEMNPKWFLLENVVMKQEYQDVISEQLGVKPIKINSALVSAQTRKRLYWTNIPEIRQPEDKGILLKDIIEGGHSNVFCAAQRGRYTVDGVRQDHKMKVAGLTQQRIEPRTDGKTNALTSVQKDNLIGYVKVPQANKIGLKQAAFEKKDNYVQWDASGKGYNSQDQRAYYLDGKHGALPTSSTMSKTGVWFGDNVFRKLTPIECERLQTVPDNYTEGVSNTQRYKMLGNGWTVDVIAHIFRHIPGCTQRPESNQRKLFQ